MVTPPSKFYTLSTVFFHKDGDANVAITNRMSHFSMFFPTKATLKLANGNTGHAQGIGNLFYVDFLTVRLYIQLDQFIIVQVTLPTLYNQVPSSFILVLRSLHLNLLNIVTLLIFKVVLGDHPTRLATILTIFNSKFSRSILTETRIVLSLLSVGFQNKLSLN